MVLLLLAVVVLFDTPSCCLALSPPQQTSRSSHRAPFDRYSRLVLFADTNNGAAPIDDKKISLALKSFSILRTVSDNMLQPGNATDNNDKENIMFSLDNIPLFKKRHKRWSRFGALKRLTAWAFQVCDVEGNGRVDKTETYAGVLLVHLRMAQYAGVAACHPPGRQEINELFNLIDWGRTGWLDEHDFSDIVVVCVSTVVSYYFSRVVRALCLARLSGAAGTNSPCFNL